MSRDGNFKARTKNVLAKCSGYRCNNPECRRMTIGAHSDPNKFISLGQACHIEAASPGGPRYNPALSAEERQKVTNGIWLCYSCSKLIDCDPDRFTVDVLNSWKAVAEDWNLRDAAMQAIPESTQVISITNVAGGTGKSTATAMISRMISSKSRKRVLCISAHESDHAIYFLNGGDLIQIRQEKKSKKKELINLPLAPFSAMEMQREIVPLLYGVDVLTFQSLKNIVFQQQLCFGESSMKEILTTLATVGGYQIVVCDCGRGDEDLQKAIINVSTDIVVPIGERSSFGSTISFLTEFGLQSPSRKNIWFVMSKGPNKYVSDSLLPKLSQLPVDRTNIHVLDTIVPYSNNLYYGNQEKRGLIKNVLSAYGKIAQTILAWDAYK